MSRYSKEDLTVMAKSAIWHKQNSPMAYNQLLSHLFMVTGIAVHTLDQRIVMMSNNDFSFE